MAVNVWSVLIVSVVSSCCAVARMLISLRRYRLRRDSLERVVAAAGPGARIVDQDVDGVIEVTVHHVVVDSEHSSVPERPAA
ncbi:hypothetical protein [Amycolatopsis sp. NPDC051071]|uniref:hypothetical protein n=1 Tax=Amycolatopsis sp. NPDC051071 TaxID=3154637 RepID=UPI00343FCCCA